MADVDRHCLFSACNHLVNKVNYKKGNHNKVCGMINFHIFFSSAKVFNFFFLLFFFIIAMVLYTIENYSWHFRRDHRSPDSNNRVLYCNFFFFFFLLFRLAIFFIFLFWSIIDMWRRNAFELLILSLFGIQNNGNNCIDGGQYPLW